MTPEEFQELVVPRLLGGWSQRCFCASQDFWKLVSFNFADYGNSPVALIDSEIVIDQLIRRQFERAGEVRRDQGEIIQAYRCPQCGANCTESYAEFSINMSRSYVTFGDERPVSDLGVYLVGFRGFSLRQMKGISDYQQIADKDEFVNRIAGHGS